MIVKDLSADYYANYGVNPGSWLRLMLGCWFNRSMGILLYYRLFRHFKLNKNKLFRIIYRRRMLKRNVDISIDADIEPGLNLPHPLGIVIGADVVISKNVTIYQNVTLGTNPLSSEQKYPVIPEGVVIGTNAVVIGAVQVKPFSVLKANTLHI